ncbi:hypothetical protein FB45DRAFT_1024816 [Roridomyces roridus]|uniref:Chitin-binding type-1 domain-containing protein n=1 Tax=Roridomyces roridus TaxID=1738132 RepID=A0AAD7C1P3_9AGAR|nr:hypothetical protein FB45DRAFT_1024816 [Roridomyces roridus]
MSLGGTDRAHGQPVGARDHKKTIPHEQSSIHSFCLPPSLILQDGDQLAKHYACSHRDLFTASYLGASTLEFGKRSSRTVDASCRFLYLNHPLLKRRVLQLQDRILRAYTEMLSALRSPPAGEPISASSNCDAKAQCGPNAPAGEEECPLNVCCSQFGFCRTTQDFCGEGCTSNCNPANPARCGSDAQTALTKRIGYYEGWAAARSCDAWSPSNINVASLTHVNFAFAYISNTFEVVEMTAGDSKLWTDDMSRDTDESISN